MGTHAAIVQKVEDGYKGIYLHWDGYPDYAGKMLDEHYTTNEKVTDLINLGSLSQLEREPNPQGKHSYDDPESDVCVAYHRDRGESLDIYYGATVQEVIDKVGYGNYVYVFEDGKWVEVG
jgi:hypothetical protein